MPREVIEDELDFGDPELNAPEDDDDAQTVENPGQVADGDIASQDAAAQQDGNAGGEGVAGDDAASRERGRDDRADGAKPRSDDKGNLIDAQGNIIAAAGAERRHYERAQQQARYIQQLEADLARVRDENIFAKVLNEAPAKLGLTPEDTEIGLQAIASFKRDPVATARWLLQETMRLGYNLQQIVGADAAGQVPGGSMDLQAVRSMISEAVQPLVSDREAAQQQREAMQAAERAYNAFLAKHEHADVHQDVIAQMLQENPQITPEVAYWQLREFVAKNGLDFTKPLRAQVEARAQGATRTAGHAQPNNAPQQSRPMPNGSAPTADMQSGPMMASADDAWDTIVRNSLREAGMM